MGLIVHPYQDLEPETPEEAAPNAFVALTPEQHQTLLRHRLEALRAARQGNKLREPLLMSIESAIAAMELALAGCLLMVVTAKDAGIEPVVETWLREAMIGAGEGGMYEASCGVCGCTQDAACAGGCSWIEPDVCSACLDRMFPRPVIVGATGGA